MLSFMDFFGSLPLYVIHRYYVFVFIDRANKHACLLIVIGYSSSRPTRRKMACYTVITNLNKRNYAIIYNGHSSYVLVVPDGIDDRSVAVKCGEDDAVS